MSKQNLSIINNPDQLALETQIRCLKQELEGVEKKISDFEAILRSRLTDELIQVQELTVLYKKQKQAKKEKRLDQKKRGKNYKAPKGLKKVSHRKTGNSNNSDQKEKKRLYREAMLHVHPDKFSMHDKGTDLATELTTNLIEIYKKGSLSELKAYHAHIFGTNMAGTRLSGSPSTVKEDIKDNHLKIEKERLEKELKLAKNKHIYKVLMEYPDPLTFVEELVVYYHDRISKLKRRTRTNERL